MVKEVGFNDGLEGSDGKRLFKCLIKGSVNDPGLLTTISSKRIICSPNMHISVNVDYVLVRRCYVAEDVVAVPRVPLPRSSGGSVS